MTEAGEPSRPRRRWRYWVLSLVAAFLAFEVVSAVKHQLSLVPWMAARNDVHAIASALDEFADAHGGRYPPDLATLVTPDAAGKCWLEGYNGHVPKDPWRHEYGYEPPSETRGRPRVISLGADGRLGGTGHDADIDSEELRESDR